MDDLVAVDLCISKTPMQGLIQHSLKGQFEQNYQKQWFFSWYSVFFLMDIVPYIGLAEIEMEGV